MSLRSGKNGRSVADTTMTTPTESGTPAAMIGVLARVSVLVAWGASVGCGGGLALDEAEGIGTNGGGTAGTDVGGSSGAAGSGAGGTGGSTGGTDSETGGDAGSGGSEPVEGPDVLLAEDFDDGDTNDWYRDCATFKVLPEAAADETAFGARLVETREAGCEQGYAGLEVPSPQTPSRVEWWMRSNSRGEIFGSFQIHQAIMVYVTDGMVVAYDGEQSKIFDIDGSQWHHYELHDIDWTNNTYSLSVDGTVQATDFGFNQPKDVAEAIYVLAAARDMSTTDPVSVDVDEIVIFE